ncbi:MAG: cupin domain-containing protein [Sandaracinaceae bacterium]|nr:cupin domain-containing protein [Sandaracinaceae bacterium]
MLALRTHDIDAAQDPESVHRAIGRVAEQSTGGHNPTWLIREPTTARDQAEAARSAVTGPAGFSLLLHRVAPGAVLTPPAEPARMTVFIVVRGALRNSTGESLPERSMLLAEKGQVVRLENGAAPAEVLQLTFVPRSGRALPVGPRIVRQRDLRPLRSRPPFAWVPDAIGDFLSPRDLYLALGPTAHGPLRFGVAGPDELVTVFVQTPRGTGPALHVHTKSTEMFCVLTGRFRITWGDDGEHEAVLGPLDTIVVPRGLNRAFTAMDEGENWILPIVVGTNDEAEDILWLEHVFEPVRARFPLLSAIASRTKLQVGHRARD